MADSHPQPSRRIRRTGTLIREKKNKKEEQQRGSKLNKVTDVHSHSGCTSLKEHGLFQRPGSLRVSEHKQRKHVHRCHIQQEEQMKRKNKKESKSLLAKPVEQTLLLNLTV